MSLAKWDFRIYPYDHAWIVLAMPRPLAIEERPFRGPFETREEAERARDDWKAELLLEDQSPEGTGDTLEPIN